MSRIDKTAIALLDALDAASTDFSNHSPDRQVEVAEQVTQLSYQVLGAIRASTPPDVLHRATEALWDWSAKLGSSGLFHDAAVLTAKAQCLARRNTTLASTL